MFDFTERMTKAKYLEFVGFMKDLQRQIGFKVSSRGWCYTMEQSRIINKDEFDKVEDLINKCRKRGYLPVDFVAEEAARKFDEIHEPTYETFAEFVESWVDAVSDCGKYYNPNWWDGEEYYIQMLVEKVDLVTLFRPICKKYHIPIGNAKGWSSIMQRADYARRFKEAEADGLKCVLLYCGDHDPDGLRISDTIRKNIKDVSDIVWKDGTSGYDPEDLEIHRFGLDAPFIEEHGLTWIDNLMTGRGKNLADPRHPNHNLPYLQNYLSEFGVRKCEANAVVVIPQEARNLCEETILGYLGDDAIERFEERKERVSDSVSDYMEEKGVNDALQDVKDLLD